MKKFLLFVCSALVIGFNSCSSDDPLVDNEKGSQNYAYKNITKIDSNWEKGKIVSSYNYTFNSKGDWIDYLWKHENGKRINNSSLTYSGNTIIQKDYDDENSLTTITYTLNNQNLVVSQTGDPYNKYSYREYEYENGYLKNIYYNYKDEVEVWIELEYTNGNLTSWKESTGRHFSFIYSDIENKTGLNISPLLEDFGFSSMHPTINIPLLPLSQKGYFGKLSRNLLKEVWNKNKTNVPAQAIYEYTFDTNGLVDKLYWKNGINYVKEEFKFYY